MKLALSRLSVAALSLLLVVAIAAQEATTQVETSATCCVVRLHEFQLFAANNGTPANARLVVRWIRSDATVKEERAFAVTDGEPADNADNFLWGTGIAPQPFGLMRRVMASATEETGTLPLRMNKAVLRWLQTTGRIGATEITIP